MEARRQGCSGDWRSIGGSARRRSGVSLPRARAWHSATGTASAASAWRPSSRPPAPRSPSRRLTLAPRPHASTLSTVPRSFGASIHQQCRHLANTRRSTRRARRAGKRDPRRQPMGYVFCAKAAVPLMRRNKGRRHRERRLRAFRRSWAEPAVRHHEGRGRGLDAGLAADHAGDGTCKRRRPGPIFTPFHQRRIAAAGETVEQYNARAAQGTMLKRPGRAEEVAAAILF